jgi:hypothetical protein
LSGKNVRVKRHRGQPFNASGTEIVNRPRAGEERARLVAPMLPLPLRRTSWPRKCGPGESRRN